MPALAGGTLPMMALEATAITAPSPAPLSTMPASSQPRPRCRPAVVASAPVAPAASPPAINTRRPSLCRKAPPSNAVGKEPSATADTSRPACSGVKPATSWKRWVVTSSMPPMANMAKAAASTPAVKAGLRKIAKSSRGYGRRAWRRANNQPPTTATASAANARGQDGAACATSFMATMSPDSVTSASTDDSRSQGLPCSTAPFGAKTNVPIKARTTTGTLMRNTEPHQKCDSKRPPTIGPSAAPTTDKLPQTAMARFRSRSSSKVTRISASVAGIMAAAPTARNARATISADAVGKKQRPATPRQRSPARTRTCAGGRCDHLACRYPTEGQPSPADRH